MNPRCIVFPSNRRSVLLLTLSSAFRTRSFAFLSSTSIGLHNSGCRSARHRTFRGGLDRAIWTRGGSLDSHGDLTMETQQISTGAGEKLCRMRNTMKEWRVDGEVLKSRRAVLFGAISTPPLTTA